MLDKIIFGDNQFFGINHMSEEKARQLSEKFKNLNAITQVLDTAYNCGIRAFMLNTNDRAKDICDYFRENRLRYPDIVFYPSLPYAHKYANAVAERGIFGALRESIFADSTAGKIAEMLMKGGRSLFEKDLMKVMGVLVDVEMKMFHDLTVRVIFLQNIVTDLLLGLGNKDVFIRFASYIREKYSVDAGFVSMNMPALVEFLLKCGIDNPIVCSSINKVGYFMNPDTVSYERVLRQEAFRPVAMSIMASGGVKLRDAVEYVCQFEQIQSIVFGASSKQHIQETKICIEESATSLTCKGRYSACILSRGSEDDVHVRRKDGFVLAPGSEEALQ